jgi:putative membrane protein
MLVNMSKLSSGINTLVDQYTELDEGINDYTSGVAQIAAGYDKIVNGMEELSLGIEKLADGNATLYSGTNSLVDGVGKLYDGSTELKDGSGELKDKTSNMESDVTDQIDEELSKLRGDSSEVISFTSEKNVNVKAVQFVLKTQAIEKEEGIVSVETTKEKLSIWEKILGLFE